MTLDERATSFWVSIRKQVYSSSEPIINWVKECYKGGYKAGRTDAIAEVCGLLKDFDCLNIEKFVRESMEETE